MKLLNRIPACSKIKIHLVLALPERG